MVLHIQLIMHSTSLSFPPSQRFLQRSRSYWRLLSFSSSEKILYCSQPYFPFWFFLLLKDFDIFTSLFSKPFFVFLITSSLHFHIFKKDYKKMFHQFFIHFKKLTLVTHTAYKIMIYELLTGVLLLRGSRGIWPQHFNFWTKQGPTVSVSNIRDIAFNECSEIILTRNFMIFTV